MSQRLLTPPSLILSFCSGGRSGLGWEDVIGDDEPASSIPPVFPSGVTGIVAGADYFCAAMAGGCLKCWGSNYDGILGRGTTDDFGDDAGEVVADDRYCVGGPDCGGPMVTFPLPVAGSPVPKVVTGYHTCVADAGNIVW